MRELSASLSVKAPAGFTIGFLTDYVCQTCEKEGSGRFPVRFTITEVAGLTLERNVTVQVQYEFKGDALPPELEVRWDPDSRLYPRFSGKVRCESADETSCRMTIGGSYEVPGGIVGQLFDAMIGVRIARGTLANLLEQFRYAAESDYSARTDYYD